MIAYLIYFLSTAKVFCAVVTVILGFISFFLWLDIDFDDYSNIITGLVIVCVITLLLALFIPPEEVLKEILGGK